MHIYIYICIHCNDHADKVPPAWRDSHRKSHELTPSRPLEIFKNKGCIFTESTLFEGQIFSRETECTTGALGRVALSGIPELTNWRNIFPHQVGENVMRWRSGSSTNGACLTTCSATFWTTFGVTGPHLSSCWSKRWNTCKRHHLFCKETINEKSVEIWSILEHFLVEMQRKALNNVDNIGQWKLRCAEIWGEIRTDSRNLTFTRLPRRTTPKRAVCNR